VIERAAASALRLYSSEERAEGSGDLDEAMYTARRVESHRREKEVFLNETDIHCTNTTFSLSSILDHETIFHQKFFEIMATATHIPEAKDAEHG
jgi:hypothetical protein